MRLRAVFERSSEIGPAGLVVGILAGLFPAFRAARVEPVSALRGAGQGSLVQPLAPTIR